MELSVAMAILSTIVSLDAPHVGASIFLIFRELIEIEIGI